MYCGKNIYTNVHFRALLYGRINGKRRYKPPLLMENSSKCTFDPLNAETLAGVDAAPVSDAR